MNQICPVCSEDHVVVTPARVQEKLCLCLGCRATWYDRGFGPEEIIPAPGRRTPITGPRLARLA